MRIISGKYKGRILHAPHDRDVRPTTDMTKESVFNIIQFGIAESKVLDLFAGSGAIGIEAISRGARDVVFCDVDRKSIEIIKENLAMVKESFRVLEGDYSACLRRLSGEKFDYIYIDPPFSKGYEADVINRLADYLEEDGMVILETKTSKVSVNTADVTSLELDRIRKYGSVSLVTFRLPQREV